MAVNIGPRIGIEGEAEYRRQIQNIIQETRTLKSEFQALSSDNMNPFKKAAEQAKTLGDAIKAQQDRIRELQKGYSEATNKWGEDDTKTLKWKQAIADAKNELNGLKAQLDKIPNAVEIVGNKFQDWGKNIKNVGDKIKDVGYAIAPVSAATAAGVGASVKSFMDFEAGMSKVEAISGATKDQMVDLGEKAKEMGAKTKFSAVESADAFSYMAMAGWKSEQMLSGIEAVMNLAAASGEDLALTSDIVTDAITAFGLSAEDSGHFADVLAAAAANSNTNVSMLGESFKYIAPVAGAMKYSIDDTAVSLGLMANAGIKSSMSGRALRNILTNMAKPAGESALAVGELGLTLKRSDGSMLSLKEVMDQLRSKFGQIETSTDGFAEQLAVLDDQLENGSITEEEYNRQLDNTIDNYVKAEDAEKARLAAMLAGKQGMAGLLAILNTSQEEYDKLTVAIENSNGAAQEMAETMLDNAQGSWIIAKSALEGAAIEAGEVLAPYLIKAADAVKELANWFSNLTQKQQDTIVKTAAIVAGIGPLLIGAGKVVGSIGTIVQNGGSLISWIGNLAKHGGILTAGIPKVAGALSGVGALLTGTLIPAIASVAGAIGSALVAAAPVVLTIGAIVAAGVLLYQNWDTIKEKAGELGQAISNKWNEVKERTHEAWESVKQSVSDAIENAKEAVSEAVQNIKDGIHDKWEEVKSNTSEAWNNVKDTVSELINNAKDTVAEVGENIRNTIQEKWENIKTSTSEAWNAVKNTVSDLIEQARTKITDTMQTIHDAVRDKWESIKERTREAWENIKGSVQAGIEGVKNFIHDGIEAIKEKFHSIIESAKNWGKDLIENFKSGISEKWDSFTDKIKGAASFISDHLGFSEPKKGPLSNFHTYAPDMMELFAKGIKDNTHLITDQISKSFNFTGEIEAGYGYIPEAGTTNNNSVRVGETVINVYGAPGQDINELAEIVDQKINARYASVKAAWA